MPRRRRFTNIRSSRQWMKVAPISVPHPPQKMLSQFTFPGNGSELSKRRPRPERGKLRFAFRWFWESKKELCFGCSGDWSGPDWAEKWGVENNMFPGFMKLTFAARLIGF